MKKHLTDSLVIGFALFSMFFGAGNVIFPPYLGLESGPEWLLGFFSYFVADIGLALLAMFAILRQGVLLARGDLESLRTGAGVSYRACLRLGEGSPAPAGFHWNDGFWEREIESQEDMPKIISRAVGAGARLYEARLDRPTLKEIYAAWLEGGRRKVKESHGTADETPTDGSFWQSGEDEPAALPGEEPPEPAPGQGAPEEGVGEEV